MTTTPEPPPESPPPGIPADTIPADQTPLARILTHDTAYWSCVATIEQRSSWMLMHNAALIGRIDPNHAGGFRAPEGHGAAIVGEIVAFYESLGARPAAYVDALATPRDLIPTLLAAGFREWPGAANNLLLYVGPDRERPAAHPVVVAATAATRAAWAAISDAAASPDTRRRVTQLNAREIADPRVTAYLAHLEGRPAARGHLFTSDGLGRVEAVHTLAAARGRGLAAAIVRRAVRDSIARGNTLTYIYAEPGGAAERLYTRLGFRLVVPDAIRGFVR